MLKKIVGAVLVSLGLLGSAHAKETQTKDKAKETQPKKYTSFDLKWYPGYQDKRYQFGFDFDLYKEYKINKLILYTHLDALNIMEPPGSFSEERAQNNPEWQPHFLQLKLDGGIKFDINRLTTRLFISTRRKMFIDLSLDTYQDHYAGISLETPTYTNKNFPKTEQFKWVSNLELKLNTGCDFNLNPFLTIEGRYDIFAWQNTMFYVSGEARIIGEKKETDLEYKIHTGTRARNGTTLYIGLEKYHKVPPLLVFGICLGGGINQYQTTTENGLFFWPLSGLRLPRFNGKLGIDKLNNNHSINSNVKTNIFELNLLGSNVKTWLEAAINLQGRRKPEKIYYDLNTGITIDFFPTTEQAPLLELGYYHTSYHLIGSGNKRPDSINWIGAYLRSKNHHKLLKDSNLLEYKIGGGTFKNTREKIDYRLDYDLRLALCSNDKIAIGIVGDGSILFCEPAAKNVFVGPELEIYYRKNTAFFFDAGYFKREKSPISRGHLSGEGIMIKTGIKF